MHARDSDHSRPPVKEGILLDQDGNPVMMEPAARPVQAFRKWAIATVFFTLVLGALTAGFLFFSVFLVIFLVFGSLVAMLRAFRR